MAEAKTQEPIALEFAGFWRRLAAFLIDGIILGVVASMFIPFWGLGFFGIQGVEDIWHNWGWAAFNWSVGSLFQTVISALYFIGFWVWRGQTLGKMALNIKVVRRDGECLTVGAALMRYVGYIIAPFTLFIVFIWIIFDRQKQGLHDKFADSYVVKVPDMTMAEPEPRASA